MSSGINVLKNIKLHQQGFFNSLFGKWKPGQLWVERTGSKCYATGPHIQDCS